MVIRSYATCADDEIEVDIGVPGFTFGDRSTTVCRKKKDYMPPGTAIQEDPDGEKGVVKTPLEAIEEGIGEGTNKRGGKQKTLDCSGECGSFFDPRQWGCYYHKMVGSCGGSTGLCDAFGAGETCTKYAKYAVIGLGVVIAILLVKRFR